LWKLVGKLGTAVNIELGQEDEGTVLLAINTHVGGSGAGIGVERRGILGDKMVLAYLLIGPVPSLFRPFI
jgi:hypothetical protein